MSDSWITAGRLKPCPGCPWIIGNADKSTRIEGQHEAFEPAFSGELGAYRVMRCHQVPDADPRGGACVGYLLSDHALDNLTVRMLLLDEPDLLDEIGSTRPLHSRYVDMRQALDEQWGDATLPRTESDG